MALALYSIHSIISFLLYTDYEGWSTYSYDQASFTLILSFFYGAGTILLTTPLIIHFCKKNQIFDNPDIKRKTHRYKTPHLGGVNIFLALSISFFACAPLSSFIVFKYVFVCLLLLLIIGLWDDLNSLNPWIKLFWQLIAAFILVVPGELNLDYLFGLFGYYTLSIGTSYPISIFLVLIIINGINLLDGINILSTGYTLMLSSLFAFWFLLIGYYSIALFAIILCGAALAFLWFNWTPASIFLGDSGSMILGLSVAFLTLSFLQSNSDLINIQSEFAIEKAPIIAISALLLPIIDTTQVFFMRIKRGNSPLRADRNHIHHKFKRAGFSDVQTTFTLLLAQMAILIIALSTIYLSYLNSLFIILSCILLLFWALSLMMKSQMRQPQ